jgi:hypothetical protein
MAENNGKDGSSQNDRDQGAKKPSNEVLDLIAESKEQAVKEVSLPSITYWKCMTMNLAWIRQRVLF